MSEPGRGWLQGATACENPPGGERRATVNHIGAIKTARRAARRLENFSCPSYPISLSIFFTRRKRTKRTFFGGRGWIFFFPFLEFGCSDEKYGEGEDCLMEDFLAEEGWVWDAGKFGD